MDYCTLGMNSPSFGMMMLEVCPGVVQLIAVLMIGMIIMCAWLWTKAPTGRVDCNWTESGGKTP